VNSSDSGRKTRANTQEKDRKSWRNEVKEWCNIGNFQNKHKQIISQDTSLTWYFTLVVNQQNYLGPYYVLLKCLWLLENDHVITTPCNSYTITWKGLVHAGSTSSLLAGIAAEAK